MITRKKSKEQIAEILAQSTKEYTASYFQNVKKPMDKQNWAALHIGFLTGLQQCGYTLEDLAGVLELVKEKLTNEK